MKDAHTAYVLYNGKIYKATVTDRGYVVGELNVLLPFFSNQVIFPYKQAA